MVLIVESLTPEFGRKFWEYVNVADYEHRNKSTGEPQFYRFSKPSNRDYPYMIELFSGRVDAGYLIPFKAKAWLDLTERKEQGEHVDSKNIRKHKNDVFRLSILLTPDTKVIPPSSIQRDLETFFSAMEKETVDLKSFGIRNQSLKEIIQKMKLIYGLIK